MTPFKITLPTVPLGVIHSCFTEKFGTPRQSGVIPDAKAVLVLQPPFDDPRALDGLEGFSHIWIIFVFNRQSQSNNWQPTVRPPRLGGNQRVGVFASRSGFRPNPIGLSVVRLERIERSGPVTRLHLLGGDFVDQTPVLDIKPYLPWADRIDDAKGGYAQTPPEEHLKVAFDPGVLAHCRELMDQGYPDLEKLIRRMIALDPRPRYTAQKMGSQEYGMRLYDLNIRWQVLGEAAQVIHITRLGTGESS